MNVLNIKKVFVGLLILGSIVMVMSGCTMTSGSGASTSASGPNQVHMEAVSFTPEQITIKKGQSITLVNDLAVIHVIANGTWNGGAPQPKIESGAPKVDSIQVNGNETATIGPFNTAGTFQLYCTVHVGMKMSVVVQ